MRTDLAEIENRNNEMETNWNNSRRLRNVLKQVLDLITIDRGAETLLSSPERF